MSYTVVFTPEAEAQLVEIYAYLEAEASAEIAARFTDGIVTHCESLRTFPRVAAGATIFVLASALPAIESVSP